MQSKISLHEVGGGGDLSVIRDHNYEGLIRYRQAGYRPESRPEGEAVLGHI